MSADGGRTPAHMGGSKTPAWGADGNRSTYDRGNVGTPSSYSYITVTYKFDRGHPLGIQALEHHISDLVIVVHGTQAPRPLGAPANQIATIILPVLPVLLVHLQPLPISLPILPITPHRPPEIRYLRLRLVVCLRRRHRLCLHLPQARPVDMVATRPLHLPHITHLRPGHPEDMEVETREVRGVDTMRGRRHQLEGVIAVRRHQEHGVVLMTTGNPDTLPLVHSGGI